MEEKLTFEQVTIPAIWDGCLLVRHWFRPFRREIDLNFLYKELKDGKAFLVHILRGKQIVGAVVYQFGSFEGYASIVVKLLAGTFGRNWHKNFTQFIDCLALGFNVPVVEFCTRHKWNHLVANAGYKEVGMLYRRIQHGRVN